MPKTGTKSAALLIAFAIINWSADQLATGQTTEGIIGLLVGLALVLGYQAVEETDHETTYDDVVEAIGEGTLTALSEEAADVVEDRFGVTDGTNGSSGTDHLELNRDSDDPRKN